MNKDNKDNDIGEAKEIKYSYEYMKGTVRETDGNIVIKSDIDKYKPKRNNVQGKKDILEFEDESLSNTKRYKHEWDTRFNSLYDGADERERNYRKPKSSAILLTVITLLLVLLVTCSICIAKVVQYERVNSERYIDWKNVEVKGETWEDNE